MNATLCWDEIGIKLDMHKVPRSPQLTFHISSLHVFKVTCLKCNLANLGKWRTTWGEAEQK